LKITKTEIIYKDTGEICHSYIKYLHSRHWRNFKKRRGECKLKQSCVVCGSNYKLHLHHKTYKNIGKERLMDVDWLCEKCHNYLHYYLVKTKSSRLNKWNVVRKMRRYYSKKKSMLPILCYNTW
jgi:hypothetical protein